MKEFLCSVFPNYTAEMYDGNSPSGKGHQLVCGGYSDRWQTKYGGGESVNGDILFCEFNVNKKITIFITGNHLWIVDLRYSGKADFWEYTNIPGLGMPGEPCCCERSRHALEADKIREILNTKIENCLFWNMVQAKAKELYSEVA